MSVMGKLNLRPFERRLVVGVLVVLFLVVNIVFVWPHFKDWGNTRDELNDAHDKLENWQKEIAQKSAYEKKIADLKEQGGSVMPDDQANQFFRTVQNQASLSSVSLPGILRSTTRTNDFFIVLTQTFRVSATEEQLVDFLYNLGDGESAIRASSLSLRPNGAHQQLEGSIDLVASYQKNARKAAPVATPAARTAPKPAPNAPLKPTAKTP